MAVLLEVNEKMFEDNIYKNICGHLCVYIMFQNTLPYLHDCLDFAGNTENKVGNMSSSFAPFCLKEQARMSGRVRFGSSQGLLHPVTLSRVKHMALHALDFKAKLSAAVIDQQRTI